MKVALVHDYIKEYGGAERVLEEFHELFPDAPIYTSVYYPQFLGPHSGRFEKMNIRTSFLQFIPFGYKFISPFRLLSPLAFKQFNFSEYDVIVTSQTGAYFPNTINKKNATLFTYTHTPPRYLYGYTTARDWKSNKILFLAGTFMNHILRMVDYYASRNVDHFIANSEEVKRRIKKFYRKDAIVVYPPVNVPDNRVAVKKDDYYVAGGRLARAKGMGIIIEAFNTNGLPLKIFGKGFAGYGEELRSKAKKNIEFVGEVSDNKKLDLMARAKSFIFASIDEDFGITPVEVMGQGTPVIAYKSGGVQETVVEGKTGVFFDEHSADSLNKAIRRFEKQEIMPNDCYTQAQKFSQDTFVQKMRKVIIS